jgi:hypothetical protein
MLLDEGRKSRGNLAFGRGIEHQQAHPEDTGRRLHSFRLGLNKFGTGLTRQHCNRVSRRHQFVQHLKALSGQLGTEAGDAGEIAGGTIEARYHANLYGVAAHHENDRDGLRRRLGGLRRCNSHDSNLRHMLANEIGGERR